MLKAGAELVTYYTNKPELVAEFHAAYPGVPLAPSMEAVLEDPTIHVIGGAAMPAECAGISITAMRHARTCALRTTLKSAAAGCAAPGVSAGRDTRQSARPPRECGG